VVALHPEECGRKKEEIEEILFTGSNLGRQIKKFY
jgi:hypothetical protein